MIEANVHLEAALAWHDQGFCVMPARFDGTKRPRFEWKAFQGKRARRETVESWYRTEPPLGVGLICGDVSGGLEMLELEGTASSGAHLDKIRAECDTRHITWLWDQLTLDGYAEWTPSGGIHLLYRVSDHAVPGNTKIAMSEPLPGESRQTYAETRGEGGFVIVAPTAGTVHQTGDAWTLAAGQIGVVPTITWADREALVAAIKAALDERVERVFEAPASRPIRERRIGEVTPMDDFNEHGDWTTILSSRGWSPAGRMAGQELWTRPGKDPRDGHSAALGFQGSDNLYVWSGMPDERHYTKAQFVAYSDFNGDWTATTRFLASEGYGTPLTSLPAPARRADYDYSDLLPPKPDVENSKIEDPQTPPAPAPRIQEWHHVGVADYAAKVLKGQFHEIFEEKGSRADAGWRVYDNGAWVEDHTKQVARAMERVAKSAISQASAALKHVEGIFEAEASDKNKKAVKVVEKTMTFANSCASDSGIKAITSRFSCQPGIAQSIKAFDSNTSLLCMDNGTFDLSTMTLREHSPDDMLTRRFPAAFDVKAAAPLWEKSLRDWLPDPEMRDYVQRAMGYTLLGEASEGVFFVPHGETGCGKTQFIETFAELFGDFGMTAEASTFRDKGWNGSEATNNLHDLRGKRFVSSSETSKGRGVDEELIKRATGGDTLTTRALFQSNVKWKPNFVLWFATNFRPPLSADDGALWRRVKPIHFPNNFSESGEKILNLAGKLVAEEAAGIFNWLLAGVLAYRERGLAEPAAMTEAIKEYREENDPVAQFLTEFADQGRVVVGEDEKVESSKLYNTFAAFCDENHIKSRMTPNRFGRMMTARGFEVTRGANGVKMRQGIGVPWLRDQNTDPRDWTQGRR